MRATSLYNKDTFLRELNGRAPQLSCDYILTIDVPRTLVKDDSLSGVHNMLITDFKFPDVGIFFENNGKVGHLQFSNPKFANLPVSFVVPASVDTSSSNTTPIHAIYNSQFINGVPRFIPIESLPVVTISKLLPEANTVASLTENSWIGESVNEAEINSTPLVVMRGCRFTYPKPGIQLDRDGVSIYSTDINFEAFELY